MRVVALRYARGDTKLETRIHGENKPLRPVKSSRKAYGMIFSGLAKPSFPVKPEDAVAGYFATVYECRYIHRNLQ